MSTLVEPHYAWGRNDVERCGNRTANGRIACMQRPGHAGLHRNPCGVSWRSHDESAPPPGR